MDENNPPNDSETFGKDEKGSESPPERFGTVRKENHTLTIKEVLKIFESKNVDITERSVVNYCHPNKYGVSLLDCYLDQNERKYFITPESAERAVEEVKARKTRLNEENHGVSKNLRKGPESNSESSGNVRKASESDSESFGKVPKDAETGKIEEYEKEIINLKQENLDLKITNRGKDYFIEQMKSERAELIIKIEDSARLIGELETKLQIGPPREVKTKEEKVVEVKIHDIDNPENSRGEQEKKGDEEAELHHIKNEETKIEEPVTQKPKLEEITNYN